MKKEQILDTAVAMAQELGGYDLLTRGPLAERAGVSTGLVNRYWQDMPSLMAAVLGVFIERQDLQQIARGLVNRHPLALELDEETRKRAALSLTA